MDKLRWGILSTAGIARENWPAILHAENCTLTAVASRHFARSQEFIGECQQTAPFETPPAALGSYEELIASPAVDAVYVPLPTGLLKEWVIRAAEAGKHILCEKPCAISAPDLEEMLAPLVRVNGTYSGRALLSGGTCPPGAAFSSGSLTGLVPLCPEPTVA
jgi:predicted dehydrogenase